MITIQNIKFNIKDFRDKLVRRTLPMSMILKALDNIEKNIDEYEHLSDKLYTDAMQDKCKEIERLKEYIASQHAENEVIGQYRPPNMFNEDKPKDVDDNDFYVKFKDALPQLIAGRRFRDSYPCGDNYQTLNEFVECSSFYILKILKGKVDLEPLDEILKEQLRKRMSGDY